MAVAKSSLRILTLERLGEVFNQNTVPLRYTPRGFALDPINKVQRSLQQQHAVVKRSLGWRTRNSIQFEAETSAPRLWWRCWFAGRRR